MVPLNRPQFGKGGVTFNGVTSSEQFQILPPDVGFSATDGIISLYLLSYQLACWDDPAWTYYPYTGVLNPNGLYEVWYDSVWIFSNTDTTEGGWEHWSTSGSDTEYGHWQLVPDVHSVSISGGEGDDTILSGQGNETLVGGEGNDLIRACAGTDVSLGGAENS